MVYAKVALDDAAGEVRFDPEQATVPQLIQAVRDAGFGAELVALKGPEAATGPPARNCGPAGVFC